MTVTVTDVLAGPFYPNGITTAFPFRFKVGSEEELRVFAMLDGVDTDLDPGLYTVVSSADGEGGTVNFTTPPSSALGAMYIEANPHFSQPANFNNNGFLPRTLNPNFDRAAMRDLLLRSRTDRALLAAPGEPGFQLPPRSMLAGTRARLLGTTASTGELTLLDGAEFQGDPGGNAESVGEFAVAQSMNLDPTGGVKQVRVVDRGKATYEKTTASLDPAGQGFEWFQDAAGKRWRLPVGVNVDPQALGAVPGAASTAPIARALKVARDNVSYRDNQHPLYYQGQNPGVVLEPGTYLAGDILHDIYTNAAVTNPSGTSRLILRARVPGTVNIIIPDGKWFMTISGRYMSVDVYGITFIGGAGAFKFTHDGNNVNEHVWFEKCRFYNYTVCAIGNMADDAPYFRAYDCIFDGGPASIGIAWGGYCDLMIIKGCIFLRNRYHLKIGPRLSGSINILQNDFIKNGTDFTRHADIWFLPNTDSYSFGSSAGSGTTIAFNKFGNENLGRFERRILIAAEDTATGPDRLTRVHSTAVAPGYVVGFDFFRNLIATLYHPDAGKDGSGNQIPGAPNDGNDAPFIGTYCPLTLGFKWAHNSHNGGRYQWLCFFYAQPGPFDQNTQFWQIDLEPDAAFQYGVVNIPIGRVTDRNGVAQADALTLPPYPAGGDDTLGILKHNGTVPAFGTAFDGAVGAADAVDQYGGPGLVKATFPYADSLVYFDIQPLGYAGFPHWLELQLGVVNDATRRMREVIVEISNFQTGQTQFSRTVQVMNGVIGPIPLQWIGSPGGSNEGAWQCRIRPVPSFYPLDTATSRRPIPTANQIHVGRAFVSIGREPVNTRHLRTVGGRWNQPHLLLGDYHMWFDSQNRLRRKGGLRPTSETDGEVFPLQAAAQADSTAADAAALKTDFNALLAKLRASGVIGS